MALLGLLLSMLAAAVSAARRGSMQAACATNIRQLALANALYAQQDGGRYCPGAPMFLANLQRWHGARPGPGEAFDSAGGTLIPFLGSDRRVRACPAFRQPRPGFEASCGGYGYNNDYIGVELEPELNGAQDVLSDLSGVRADNVTRPGETVMFADAAFAAWGGVIEYSFAHARFQPAAPGQRFDPSIHFRHDGQATVAWCDGHVDRQALSFSWSSGLYPAAPAGHAIGWFGREDDNHFFDLQ
jgi:prepilin-type processing-associated H-X9-DG protein